MGEQFSFGDRSFAAVRSLLEVDFTAFDIKVVKLDYFYVGKPIDASEYSLENFLRLR